MGSHCKWTCTVYAKIKFLHKKAKMKTNYCCIKIARRIRPVKYEIILNLVRIFPRLWSILICLMTSQQKRTNSLVRQPNDMIDRLSINTATFFTHFFCTSPSGMRNYISVVVRGKNREGNRPSNSETRKGNPQRLFLIFFFGCF
jgi:hypothetical protein